MGSERKSVLVLECSRSRVVLLLNLHAGEERGWMCHGTVDELWLGLGSELQGH